MRFVEAYAGIEGGSNANGNGIIAFGGDLTLHLNLNSPLLSLIKAVSSLIVGHCK